MLLDMHVERMGVPGVVFEWRRGIRDRIEQWMVCRSREGEISLVINEGVFQRSKIIASMLISNTILALFVIVYNILTSSPFNSQNDQFHNHFLAKF